MNIILNDEDINVDHIQFLHKKNNMVMEGDFTKIIYSDELITMNGIYLSFPIQIKSIYKNTAFFENLPENMECIQRIIDFENKILQHYSDRHSAYQIVFSSIKKQFMTNTIKLHSFHHIHNECIIKISGIWENNNTIGMTYKFIQVGPLNCII
jgi:hypothetical protein